MKACFWPWLTALFTLTSADSIMDMINMQEVERLISERKNSSHRHQDHNFLQDSDDQNFVSRRNETEELLELMAQRGDKLLQSSKEALLITKKEYLRQDWCKTEPLVQIIKEEGCSPVTILNHFCYGQCNSFFIPKPPRHKEKATKIDVEVPAFKSCAVCRPKRTSMVTVALRCRRKRRVILRRKRVLRVKECKCLV